ncbi:TPA: hypothetical protein SLP45_002949 [Klebsiella oxytoca]|nr:hypothetical protein [Klebsiella oxytoca]HEJ0351972.1 hypothetical protein [Klebsiella oxytoca]
MMPEMNPNNVVDSLLVSLGVDVDDKSFKAASDTFNGLKSTILQLGATAGVGFGFRALTSGLSASVLEMDRLSRITGFTIRQVESLRYAMRQSGLNPDSANQLAQKIPAWRQAARQGELGDRAYWSGKFNPVELLNKSDQEALEYIVSSYGVMNNEQRRTLRQGLGIGDNDDTTRLFENGIQGLQKAYEEFQELYQPIDQKLIDAANEFNKEMAKLSVNFENLQKQIGGPLLADLNACLKLINDFVKENNKEISSIISGEWYDDLLKYSENAGNTFRSWLKEVFVSESDPVLANNLATQGTFRGYSANYLNNAMNRLPSAYSREIQSRESITPGVFDRTYYTEASIGGAELNNSQRGSSTQPLGVRNRNPGNLRFANQYGAIRGEGGFAKFGNDEAGISALHRQLGLYFGRGINTISKIVNKYAPASDNNDVPAYINALMRVTGKSAHEILDFGDTETIISLMNGIINQEVGRGHYSRNQIGGVVRRNSAGAPAVNLDAYNATASTVPSISAPAGGGNKVEITQINHNTIQTGADSEEVIRRIEERDTTNLNEAMAMTKTDKY